MSSTADIEALATQEYKYGFFTEIEADSVPPGLNEEIIRAISARKSEPEFMLGWRLKAYRHWLTMTEPTWANIHHAPIDYQTMFISLMNGTEPREGMAAFMEKRQPNWIPPDLPA